MLNRKLQPQPESTKHGSQQQQSPGRPLQQAPRLVQVNIRRQSNFYKSSAMSITRLGGGTLLTLASRVSTRRLRLGVEVLRGQPIKCIQNVSIWSFLHHSMVAACSQKQ